MHPSIHLFIYLSIESLHTDKYTLMFVYDFNVDIFKQTYASLNGINHLLTGAGFLPSILSLFFQTQHHFCSNSTLHRGPLGAQKEGAGSKHGRGPLGGRAGDRFWEVVEHTLRNTSVSPALH